MGKVQKEWGLCFVLVWVDGVRVDCCVIVDEKNYDSSKNWLKVTFLWIVAYMKGGSG